MSDAEYQPWRARIRRPDGRMVGAGFLVDQQHVVTCAHVAADALGVSGIGPRPEGTVLVDFPTAGTAAPVPARVVEDGWTPVAGDDRGDVAVLDLADPPPPGVERAPLRRQYGADRVTIRGVNAVLEMKLVGEWMLSH